MHLEDLVLRHLHAESHRFAGKTPYNLTSGHITPSLLASSEDAQRHAIELRYALYVNDAEEIRIWSATIAFVMTVDFEQPTTLDDLDARIQELLKVVEPHLRQLVHRLTADAGLPPLLLDLGRHPEPSGRPDPCEPSTRNLAPQDAPSSDSPPAPTTPGRRGSTRARRKPTTPS